MTEALAPARPAAILAAGLLAGLAAYASGPALGKVLFGGGAPTLETTTPSLSPAAILSPDVVQPFILKAANLAERERAVRCLTDAIYYEAAQEPEENRRTA